MVDFGQALRDYVRFGYCTSLGNIATFGEIFGGGGSGIGEFGIQAARFLHNQVCNRPAPPLPPPSYEGGQCPVDYFITTTQHYERQSPPLSGTQQQNNRLRGPITRIQFVQFPDENQRTELQIDYAFGTYVQQTNAGSAPPGNPLSFTFSNFTQSVQRVDGQPDNCGSPTPTIPPYIPGSNSTTNNVTYTNDDGVDVTIPVAIAFGYGKVDINGNLTVPFSVNLDVTPTANITGNFNLNTGDVNYNAGNPALPPSSCGGNSDDFVPDPSNLPPTSPGNPNVPDPPADPDQPEYRKLLTGCLVTVSEVAPSTTEIFQTGNPNVYGPDLGLVSFKISVGGFVGWTEDIRVKNKRQFIPCPWKGGAIAVLGTAREGGVMTVTPIYEKVTVTPNFPA